jgi:DNA polymerase-1
MKKHNLKINFTPNDTILILDGKYLIYRTQYSKNMGTLTHNDIKTGVYYGFFNTIRSLIKKFEPENLVIMWDGSASIRRDEYAGYKNRNNFKYLKPEQINTLKEINKSYPYLIETCEHLGFASYIMNGYEADDLIALFIKRFSNVNKVIITRDEDMYQCINKNTIVYDPDNKFKKNYKWFKEKYDIEPEQWALVKAYAGCKSDTVPGIYGVGESKAIKIIKGDSKETNRLQESNQEEIELWKRLTVLPHPNLNETILPYKITHINVNKFYDICQQFNFRSLIENMYQFELLK